MKSSFLPKYEQDFCPHYTGQKFWQVFVHILGETMTHSEIVWPLVARIFLQLNNQANQKMIILYVNLKPVSVFMEPLNHLTTSLKYLSLLLIFSYLLSIIVHTDRYSSRR